MTIPELQIYQALNFDLVMWDPADTPDGKGPRESGWPSKDYPVSAYQPGMCVGAKTGTQLAPGRYLADVDFDWVGGAPLIDKFFPATFSFGRPSKYHSHSFFTTPQPVPTNQYRDIDNSMLVECRGVKETGAIGFQTMLPPSLHKKSGEKVTMRRGGESTHDDKLPRRVLLYAISCALLKHLGNRGFTHDNRLCVSGFLLTEGLIEKEVVDIGEALAKATNNDVRDVADSVRDTAQRLERRARVTGAGVLAEAIGENGDKVVARIRQWVGSNWEKKLEAAIHDLNNRYFMIDVGTETVVGEEVPQTDGARQWSEFRFRSFGDFRNKLIKETVKVPAKPKKGNEENEDDEVVLVDRPLADVWLRDKRGKKHDQLGYSPPGSGIRIGPNDLNGWHGFTVRATPGKWAMTRDMLIRDVMCGGRLASFDWTLDWAAAMFQKPGLHAETSIGLIGLQGTGKNFLAEFVFGRTFDGRHARVTTHTRQVLGDFNDILSGVCLLVLDEVGLNTQAEYNAMKGLITGHTLHINRKNIQIASEPSMLHVICLSNADVPLKIAGDDRRFAFFKFADTYQNNTKFFGAVARELDQDGGRAAMLHELLARKVDWDRLRLAPDSEPKQKAKRESWTDAQWFFYRTRRGASMGSLSCGWFP